MKFSSFVYRRGTVSCCLSSYLSRCFSSPVSPGHGAPSRNSGRSSPTFPSYVRHQWICAGSITWGQSLRHCTWIPCAMAASGHLFIIACFIYLRQIQGLLHRIKERRPPFPHWQIPIPSKRYLISFYINTLHLFRNDPLRFNQIWLTSIGSRLCSCLQI